jgi:hypothetical protein
MDVWVRVWKALNLSEDFVPVGDSLEEGSLFKAEAIQKLASSLTIVMPCDFVHIGQSHLVGTTQKCRSLSNLKNVDLFAVVVDVPPHYYIPPAIFKSINQLQQCDLSLKCFLCGFIIQNCATLTNANARSSASPNSVTAPASSRLEDLARLRAIRPIRLSY